MPVAHRAHAIARTISAHRRPSLISDSDGRAHLLPITEAHDVRSHAATDPGLARVGSISLVRHRVGRPYRAMRKRVAGSSVVSAVRGTRAITRGDRKRRGTSQTP